MPTEYSFSEVVAPTAILLPVATITVVLRCWVKKRLVNQFALDDWLMLVSFALFTAMCAFSIKAAYNGYGRYMHVSFDLLLETAKICFIQTLVYLAATVTVKLSISILLLRLAIQRIHRWLILGTAIFYTICGTSFIMSVLFQCSPISYYWDRTIEGGWCQELKISTAFAYMNAVISAATDLILASVPIWLIWNLQMDTRTKVSVGVVLGLGLITSLVAIIRLFYVNRMVLNDDYSYDNVFPIAVIGHIEVGFGIIAASLATLRPVLRIIINSFPGRSFISTTETSDVENGKDITPGGSHGNSPRNSTVTASSRRTGRTKLSIPDDVQLAQPQPSSQRLKGAQIPHDVEGRGSIGFGIDNFDVDLRACEAVCSRARETRRCSIPSLFKAQAKAVRPPINQGPSYHISEKLQLVEFREMVQKNGEGEEKMRSNSGPI